MRSDRLVTLLSCGVLAVAGAGGPLRAASTPPGQPKEGTPPAGAPAFALTDTIPLPAEVTGRLDHLVVHEGRVYVAAHDLGALVVVETGPTPRVDVVRGLPGAQGVAATAGWGGGVALVACGGDGKVHALGVKGLKEVGAIAVGEDADNLRLPDLPLGRGYVGAGSGDEGAIVEFDSLDALPRPERRAGVGGHPEGFVLLPGPKAGAIATTRALVNVPEKREVVAVDLGAMRVEARWPLKDARDNFPIAVQEISGKDAGADRRWRVFVGCRRPSVILVLDGADGEELARVSCGSDIDDLFFDGATGKLVAVCGEGVIECFERGADPAPGRERWTRTRQMTTRAGARTGFLRPGAPAPKDSGRLYIAAPSRAGAPAEIRVYRVE